MAIDQFLCNIILLMYKSGTEQSAFGGQKRINAMLAPMCVSECNEEKYAREKNKYFFFIGNVQFPIKKK